MARTLFIFGLILQICLINCQEEELASNGTIIDDAVPLEIVRQKPIIDEATKTDFFKTFFGDHLNFAPTSSASLMSQITNSDKPAEEQIKDIKELADQIQSAIQFGVTNLLSYALVDTDIEKENELRSKRSVESPMASIEMIMRLLKHIKSNNDYQNIAIEKMMTAQELADKFGIDFNPDPEIISDLISASNEQTKELSSIINTDEPQQTNDITFVPMQDYCPINGDNETSLTDDKGYYMYTVEPETIIIQQNFPSVQETSEFHTGPNHMHPHHHHHNFETQVVAPPVQKHPSHPHHCAPPVSPKPTIYDVFEPVVAVTPIIEFYQEYCTVVPEAVVIEELIEPEPQLVGEEYEETISSKVLIDHDEPGMATVNHVMTYTLSEKAHFKSPQIEQLPQHMQYSFLLM